MITQQLKTLSTDYVYLYFVFSCSRRSRRSKQSEISHSLSYSHELGQVKPGARQGPYVACGWAAGAACSWRGKPCRRTPCLACPQLPVWGWWVPHKSPFADGAPGRDPKTIRLTVHIIWFKLKNHHLLHCRRITVRFPRYAVRKTRTASWHFDFCGWYSDQVRRFNKDFELNLG